MADSGRQFVDSNVLVYARDESAGRKRDLASDLVRGLWESGQGCVSIQVLQEAFVILTRKVARPLASASAQRVIEDLLRWNVHCPQPEDLIAAIELHRRARMSFRDAMVLRSAEQLGCAVVWSEDLNAGQAYSGVMVKSPFALE